MKTPMQNAHARSAIPRSLPPPVLRRVGLDPLVRHDAPPSFDPVGRSTRPDGPDCPAARVPCNPIRPCSPGNQNSIPGQGKQASRIRGLRLIDWLVAFIRSKAADGLPAYCLPSPAGLAGFDGRGSLHACQHVRRTRLRENDDGQHDDEVHTMPKRQDTFQLARLLVASSTPATPRMGARKARTGAEKNWHRFWAPAKYGQAQRGALFGKHLHQLQDEGRVEHAKREAVNERADDEAGHVHLKHMMAKPRVSKPMAMGRSKPPRRPFMNAP